MEQNICGISDLSWEILKLMDLSNSNPLYDLGRDQDLQILFCCDSGFKAEEETNQGKRRNFL